MATRAVSAPLRAVPNALTILRLALIPLFVGLMLAADPANWPAGVVFAVAGITDQVDGFLARRWHVESPVREGRRPARRPADDRRGRRDAPRRRPAALDGAAVILARDVALVAGYKLVVPRGYDFEVSFLGKLATWVLYAALTFLIVTSDGTDWPLWLFWIGVAIALVAAAQYLLKARREVHR